MFNNRMLSIILMAALLLLIIPPVSGVAQLSWSKTIGFCVTAVDTNDVGTIIYAGLGNGSIFAYDNSGNLTWAYSTNSTATLRGIKKIVADTDGNLAWINQANESGYISYTGTVGGIVKGTGRNVTDVGLMANGNRYATTELTPPRIIVHYQNGTSEVQNTTFGNISTISTRWTKIGYDANGEWLVTANESSGILYFWNFTQWVGWEQFNPTHTVSKNSSQIYLDSFQFRQNISVSGPGSIGLIFHNTTNVTYITRLNASYFEYNPVNTGNYFYWTAAGNLSNNQTGVGALLNLSWINTTTGNYHVVLNPGVTNYTVYFGLAAYNNSIVTTSNWQTNGTQYTNAYTSSTTWTSPFGTSNISLFLVGGGGAGGGACSGCNSGGGCSYGSHGTGGSGGGAGTQYTNNSVTVTQSTPYGITIGGSGGDSSAFSLLADNGTGGVYCGSPAAFGYGTAGGNGWDGGSGGQNGSPNQYGENIYGAGGTGYGGGGGGGAGGLGFIGNTLNGGGAGGSGASGYASVTYYVYDIPSYYFGATPTSSFTGSIQNILITTGMNQTSSKSYVGNILGLSVPQSGGLVSIVTDTIFYQQYMSSYGFGITYCATLSSGGPALFAGTPYAVAASNSGAASIEGRGAYGNVYDAGGVAKASSLTGGTIRAADSSMSTGIFAAFGGDDGKIYMLSREGSSSWYSFYTGAADTRIDAVSVAWDGSSVSVGRFGGTLEYYLTNVTVPVTPTTTFVDTSIYVFKDGAAYANQPVTVYSSPTTPSSWVPVMTVYTDGAGKVTYTTTSGTYYKFVVNNVPGTESGEGEKIWQSSAAATTVYIYVLTPSTPYEWNAYYTDSTSNVTVIYSDSITPSSVTVTIKDLKTNLNVMTRTYSSTPSFVLEYHDTTGMGSYQVNIVINRLNMISRDQRMVSSSNTYGITLPVDIYIVYAISTIFLMLLAGMFSYANSKRGALAVVVVAVVMMIFKLLPWSMITVAMLAAIFAVMSLFASRVQ